MSMHLIGDQSLLSRPRLALLGSQYVPGIEQRTTRLLKACADRSIVVVLPYVGGWAWSCAAEAMAMGVRVIGVVPDCYVAANVAGQPIYERELVAHLIAPGQAPVRHEGPEMASALVDLSSALALVGAMAYDPGAEAKVALALAKRLPVCILPAVLEAQFPAPWAQAALSKGAHLLAKPSDLDWLARLGQA